jgi:hypothetical protein
MMPPYHSPTNSLNTADPRPVAMVNTLTCVVTLVHNQRRCRRSFHGVSSIFASQLCTYTAASSTAGVTAFVPVCSI